MTTRHVVVMPYDLRWAQDFEKIASEIWEALGELALRIEHVGSTSVPGLSAKPIIDIDVVIRDYSLFDAVAAPWMASAIATKVISASPDGRLSLMTARSTCGSIICTCARRIPRS